MFHLGFTTDQLIGTWKDFRGQLTGDLLWSCNRKSSTQLVCKSDAAEGTITMNGNKVTFEDHLKHVGVFNGKEQIDFELFKWTKQAKKGRFILRKEKYVELSPLIRFVKYC